jgi:hypothetical protein
MATGRDVRDMLGLPMGGDAQKGTAVQKRAKPAAPARRIRTSQEILQLRNTGEAMFG